MKYCFALAGLAALATASDVHDLTKDTFEPFVKEHGLVLAECTFPITICLNDRKTSID